VFWIQVIVRLVYLENLLIYLSWYLENNSWFLTIKFHAQEKQLHSSTLAVTKNNIFFILHLETSRINFYFGLEVLNFSYASSVWELHPFSETTQLTSQKYPLNMPCDPRSIRFVNIAWILAKTLIDNEYKISFIMRTHTGRNVYWISEVESSDIPSNRHIDIGKYWIAGCVRRR
jgi:hypothetical protein